MSMATPLARARGLDSAEQGAEHWWQERLTSIAAFLLLAWLAVSLLRLPGLDHRTVTNWLAEPFAAVPMLLLIVSTFWHLKLGLQVVVEDYVHEPARKLLLIIFVNFLSVAGAALAIFSIVKIAASGSAS